MTHHAVLPVEVVPGHEPDPATARLLVQADSNVSCHPAIPDPTPKPSLSHVPCRHVHNKRVSGDLVFYIYICLMFMCLTLDRIVIDKIGQ